MRLLLAGLLLAFGSQAFAAEKFGMAGCGLGSMMFGSDMQVLAATFNSTGANQGFGISSGTSNCLQENAAVALKTQQEFFATNITHLSKEMAQGNGDYVRAFAKTMGCNEAINNAFASEMQKSYDYIFSAPGAMASLERVRATIHSNKDLNANCDTVI